MELPDCLPTGRDEMATRGEVTSAISGLISLKSASEGAISPPSRWTFELWEEITLYQNSEHHMEGWLYNHIILMLKALRNLPEYGDLTDMEIHILEQAIMWSDLGKLATYAESPEEKWPDGSPQGTTIGHARKSAEIFYEFVPNDSGLDHFEIIRYLIEEHMSGHMLSEMDERGRTSIPEFLRPQVGGIVPGLWPSWDDLVKPHGESLSKKDYAWMQRGASKLLRIMQKCDLSGRICSTNRRYN